MSSQDTIKEFWPISNKLKSITIVDTNGNGIKKMFYEKTETIRYSCNIINFRKDGKCIFLRENGTPLKTTFYKNDFLDSIYIEFAKNGLIEEIRTYSKDTLVGFLFDFYDTGQLRNIRYYDKNYSIEIYSPIYAESFYLSGKINTLKNQLPNNVYFRRSYYKSGRVNKNFYEINSTEVVLHFDKMGKLLAPPGVITH